MAVQVGGPWQIVLEAPFNFTGLPHLPNVCWSSLSQPRVWRGKPGLNPDVPWGLFLLLNRRVTLKKELLQQNFKYTQK